MEQENPIQSPESIALYGIYKTPTDDEVLGMINQFSVILSDDTIPIEKKQDIIATLDTVFKSITPLFEHGTVLDATMVRVRQLKAVFCVIQCHLARSNEDPGWNDHIQTMMTDAQWAVRKIVSSIVYGIDKQPDDVASIILGITAMTF
jgi:hypothetical protein